MGLLRRNLTTSSAKLREQAFISLVRSGLEYCCAIWDPHLAKDRDNLEATKGCALRNPRLLSGYQHHTAAEGPTLAAA